MYTLNIYNAEWRFLIYKYNYQQLKNLHHKKCKFLLFQH